MKPIITKQEAVTTYTITLTEKDMDALLNSISQGFIWDALNQAKKEADGE